MKIKFITIFVIAFTLGLGSNVNAQEESTGGEDFWKEGVANDSANKATESEPSAAREGATATVKPVANSCSNRDELREEARLLLRPYRYNLAKTTTVNFKRYPQKMNVLIPIYSSQEHRLVFSTKGLPQDVVIKIYDKHSSEKKRKVLFTSNPAEPINTFQLPEEYKESYLFLEYAIPPSEAEDRSEVRRGCIIMMMGYLYLPEGEPEQTVTAE